MIKTEFYINGKLTSYNSLEEIETDIHEGMLNPTSNDDEIFIEKRNSLFYNVKGISYRGLDSENKIFLYDKFFNLLLDKNLIISSNYNRLTEDLTNQIKDEIKNIRLNIKDYNIYEYGNFEHIAITLNSTDNQGNTFFLYKNEERNGVVEVELSYIRNRLPPRKVSRKLRHLLPITNLNFNEVCERYITI